MQLGSGLWHILTQPSLLPLCIAESSGKGKDRVPEKSSSGLRLGKLAVQAKEASVYTYSRVGLSALALALTISCTSDVDSESLTDERVSTPECDADSTLSYLESLDTDIRTRDQFLEVPPEFRGAVSGSLTAEVKHALWVDKLVDAGASGFYTPEESEALVVLAERMTPALWDYDDTTYGPGYQAQQAHVEELLGPEAFADLASTLADAGTGSADYPLPPPADSAGPPTKKNCNCSKTSDYCSFPWPHTVTCHTKSCTTVPSDCGTFNMYDCDGICRVGRGTPELF